MDFGNILSNITDSLKNLYENKVKKNKFVFMVGLVVFLLIIVLISVIANSSKNKNTKKPIEEPKLILTQNLLVPNGPEMDNEYNISRKTEDKWNSSDADVWFTVPSDKEIQALSVSNENMVKELIGAAP